MMRNASYYAIDWFHSLKEASKVHARRPASTLLVHAMAAGRLYEPSHRILS